MTADCEAPARVDAIDWRGRPAWQLHGDGGARLLVARHGAQPLSWITADGRERLYCTPWAPAGPQRVVRGGIPVVFPQFGAEGPLPKHGFARDRPWRCDGAVVEAGVPVLRLRLRDDAATRALWPHGFEAVLALRLAPMALDVTLTVAATGGTPLVFTAALHTYLRIDPSLPPVLEPIEGRLLAVDGAIDRVFADAGPVLTLADAAGRLQITHEGFPDAVVWNPGPDGAAALGDLPPADWRAMLCVEAACVRRPVRLAPGARWRGRQRLQVLNR